MFTRLCAQHSVRVDHFAPVDKCGRSGHRQRVHKTNGFVTLCLCNLYADRYWNMYDVYYSNVQCISFGLHAMHPGTCRCCKSSCVIRTNSEKSVNRAQTEEFTALADYSSHQPGAEVVKWLERRICYWKVTSSSLRPAGFMWVVKEKGTACPTRISPLRAFEQDPQPQSLPWSWSAATGEPVAVLGSFQVWMCNRECDQGVPEKESLLSVEPSLNK